jgi:hypothetical protein
MTITTRQALRFALYEIHNPGSNRANGVDIIELVNKALDHDPAPAMLAALKEALTAWPESFDGDAPLQSCADVVEWFTEWRKQAKAAIAAAEGR